MERKTELDRAKGSAETAAAALVLFPAGGEVLMAALPRTPNISGTLCGGTRDINFVLLGNMLM